jgi:phosphotransferase system  glucose/maltose/N-acetylglucosamine-specific IIC component
MITAIILSGMVLGVGNALMSTMLMGVSHAQPAVGASATNFIRFVGGAIAPFLAGKLSESVSISAPLYMGAGAVIVGATTLVLARRLLGADTTSVPIQLDLEELAAEERLEFAA